VIADSDAVAPPIHGHEYDQSSAVVRIQTLSRVAARYEKEGEERERAHFVSFLSYFSAALQHLSTGKK
jgi:hypothetical protein